MEANITSVKYPLVIQPVVGCQAYDMYEVGKKQAQILIVDSGSGERQGSSFIVQKVFSGSADRPFWGKVAQ